MYICSCHAVTDGQIKRCVNDGSVCTWKELMKKTKVGTQCGTCAKFAFALFKELKTAKDADDKKKDDSDATEQP